METVVTTKTTNDLKKGDKVLLSYGEQNGDLADCGTFDKWLQLQFNGATFKAWEGIVMDNKRGDTRLLEVHGWEKDLGSVYSHQIIGWFSEETGTWEPIQHTPKQLECKERVKSMGF